MENELTPTAMDDVAAPAGRRAVIGIGIGTVVMGLSGLVVLVCTAATLGAEDYALFGVFWAALYFVVTVVTGAQHEATRASLTPAPRSGTSLMVFAVALASVLFVVVGGSSWWWSGSAFGEGHRWLGLLVGLGSAGYAVNCVLGGALAGVGAWRSFAALLIVEGVVRAGGVGLVMLTSGSVATAVWVVVLTYPVTLAVVAVGMVRARTHLVRVSASLGQLCRNTAKTMTASAGAGALITGFPVLMSITSRGTSSAVLGALTLAVMLTRAPLLVPLTGMQSLLVRAFGSRERPPWQLLRRLLVVTAVIAAALSALAALIGNPVLTTVFGDEFSVRPAMLALLVISSGSLAAMMLTAPALIARGALGGNAAAWMVASVVAVAVLAAAPGALGWRAGAALVAGPSVGLVMQLLALRRSARADARGDAV